MHRWAREEDYDMRANNDRTSQAIAWASVEMLVRQGVQFASLIFLARLLSPSEFGLVAMLGIFTTFATLIINSGFASALIRQPGENDLDSSTVFWFNIGTGTFMALLLVASAPAIARFYGHTELTPIAWALALNVWLASWLTVHVALLTRHLEFRVQAKASSISNLAGAILAIVLALRGAGVWALLAQLLATTSLNVALIWAIHRWRPTLTFSMKSLRRLFGFGGFMLAADILNALGTRLHTLLIGKLYSSQDLGLYTRAVQTCETSQTVLSTIFTRVAMPVLARHSEDRSALRRRLKAANELTIAISLPAMIGLALVADVAVPTIFGPQWAGTVPILQVLCVSSAIYPLQVSNLQVLIAQGRSGSLFRIEIMKKSILISAMVIASHWGILAIAWSTVGSALMAFLINAHYSRTLLDYGPLSQLKDLKLYAVLTIGMGVVVVLAGYGMGWISPGKRLAVEVFAGAGTYVILARLARIPALGYALDVLRSLRQRA